MVDPRQQQQRMSQISMDEDFEPEQNGNQTGSYICYWFLFLFNTDGLYLKSYSQQS